MLTIQDRETCVRLKLIGRLKIGDKIAVRWLSIQQDSFLTKWNRWCYGENRRESVEFVRNCILQAKEIILKNTDKKIKDIIQADLVNAKLGIISLQTTYIADVRIHSELQEIVEGL